MKWNAAVLAVMAVTLALAPAVTLAAPSRGRNHHHPHRAHHAHHHSRGSHGRHSSSGSRTRK